MGRGRLHPASGRSPGGGLPGSVEGDFDPTSSAIALDPCDVPALLPPGALAATFERYWEELEARRAGRGPNHAYTPYEVRNATALLRLGWRERALSQLAWLIEDQRPTAWRQWPEIAWRDRRAPRFFGDLPHGWVASSFLRAARRLVAYERGDDGALVLAAGIPLAGVRAAPGVRTHGLPTHFGTLDLTMVSAGDDEVLVRLGGTARPPGCIVVTSPDPRPLREGLVDGAQAAAAPGYVALAALAGEVRLRLLTSHAPDPVLLPHPLLRPRAGPTLPDHVRNRHLGDPDATDRG